jgi:hypothetical protein
MVLGTIPLAVIARQTRSAMLEMLSEGLCTHGTCQGHVAVPPRRSMSCAAQCDDPGHHHHRPAGRRAAGGAILTETIFSWPGIGKWMVDSVFKRDYVVVQGGLLLIAAHHHGVNLIVDVLYGRDQPAYPALAGEMMAETAQPSFPSNPTGARRSARVLALFLHQSRRGHWPCGLRALLVLIAIFAPLLAPHSPDQQYRDAVPQTPFWDAASDPRFLLGTDPVGRDMLSRLIYGARYSLFIGFFVVTAVAD